MAPEPQVLDRVPEVFGRIRTHARRVHVTGMRAITPLAMEIAARETDEHLGHAGIFAFALDGTEHLDNPGFLHTRFLFRAPTTGSTIPARAKPLARKRQLSHTPQTFSPPL